MADDKSHKDSLKYAVTTAALKATATYLWPFTNGRWSRPRIPTLREAFHAAVKGTLNTFRFAGILTGVYLANQVIQPFTAQIFPSGEDYLKAHNIDPEIAAKLSDNQIYVRPDNMLGKIHRCGDVPTLIGIIADSFKPDEHANAFALPRGRMNPFNARFFNQCHVTLQGEGVTAEDTINALAGRGKTDSYTQPLEYVPISDEESYMTVAFHEFAHCETSNTAVPSLAESDADHRGVTEAAAIFNNPEIYETIKYARALNTRNAPHDTSLYMDKYQGKEPPERKNIDDDLFSLQMALGYEGIHEPTEDVFDLARIFSENTFAGAYKTKQARIMNAMLQEHGDLLSDDAKRRGELFVEAAKYFFPSQIPFITMPYEKPSVLRAKSPHP